MKKLSYILLCIACALFTSTLSVFAGDEKGFSGAFVDDPNSMVQPGAYFAISSVYNGRRYYLGVDTVAAQAPTNKDTVTWYEGPSYATMWIAGPSWSPTGEILADKNYSRTVKNVWLAERVSRERYLALGTETGTYRSLRLLADGALWYTEKDSRERNRYINGYLYYYSPATETGVEVYRYLSFDPVYGFSRLREAKSASQRITIWDRKTGSDLIYHMTPATISYGYDVTHDTVMQPITSQVIYYTDVDRFRSRYDHIDIFARQSTPITNQEQLVNQYGLVGHFEWKSNPADEAHLDLYDGHSKMQYYTITGYDTSNPANPVAIWDWADTTMVWARKNGFKLRDNIWYDTIYAIGRSPLDRPSARFLRKPAGGGAPTEGDYVNHSDVLYTHFTCDGKEYRDSVNVIRQTFHRESYTNMDTHATPEGKVFNYSEVGAVANPADTAWTFTISGDYESGYVVRSASNNVVDEYIGESGAVNIAALPCYRDTIWQVDSEGEYIYDGEGERIVDNIVLYDTLLVEALNIDGTPSDWVVKTYLPALNLIRVQIQPYNDGATANRTAQIRYTYRYRHSIAVGDWAEDTRSIWITQKWKGADDAKLYEFHHSGELGADGLQATHEKKNTFYAIPGEDLSLPLHRDHWGYYRWFNYDAANRDKDVQYNNVWTYTAVPKNVKSVNFMEINYTDDASSRGRWDVIKDAEHPGTTYFGTDHFKKWTRTAVPAVSYPESNSKTGKIACDVSDYYNIETTGAIGELTSLTEPTLSYRQIFDIQPAKTRADEMATVLRNGSGTKWLENYTIVAPAGRAFTIQPQCPIAYVGTEEINEEHLQYIYYFNPTGTNDANMGTKSASYQDNTATCYNRIGKKRKTGDPKYRAQLLSPSSIDVGTSKNVIMVNPRKGTGFVLGKDFATIDFPDSVRDGNATTLQHFLENRILNTAATTDAYKLILKRESSGEISIRNGNDYLQYDYDDGLEWTNESGRPDRTMEYSAAATSSNYITGTQASSVKLWMHAAWWLDIIIYREGYLMSYDYSRQCVEWGIIRCKRYEDVFTRNIYIQEYLEDDEDESNRGWLFYEIINPDEVEHFETPRWEKSADGITWNPADSVAVWDYKTNTAICKEGYSMTADGALHIGDRVFSSAGTPIFYRLRTEHFQLAMFKGVMRDAETEMLKVGGDIISEEDVEREYDILYKLDMEDWPAPGTTNVVAYNEHFPLDFTELSFHRPLSIIPESRRVDSTEMPGKGEYAFINKFVVPEGPTTKNPGMEYECMAGAEHGYMLCVNAAGKRTTIMNFDFNQMTCSNQQIYLVGNYCNPVDNSFEPEITADMEGSNDGGNTWTRIYRYKSGKIPYKSSSEHHWHQMALPISRDSIAKYQKFRCRAEISGGSQHNAHLLIDRLRFIEKDRAFSVFQNKATCVREDSVVALIRINYQSDPDLYQPGKLIAYQFQKWDKDANAGAGGYVPMLASKTTDGGATYTALDYTTTPKLEVFPGYLKDGFTAKESVEQPSLKSMTGNDYGYVMIPEANYDPSASGASSGQSALRGALIDQALTKLGITGAAAAERKANFLNETSNIRTFDQIVSSDYNDWGVVEFGQIKTAHIKSFVNVDGTWLLYIVCRLPVDKTDNNTFRIGMTVMNNLNDKPNFADESCATFRILKVKQTTSLLLDGEAWPNYSRAVIEADPSDDKKLLPSNETYRASIKLTVKDAVGIYPTHNPRCKFDLLHAADSVRPNTVAGNLAFLRRYGCSRTQFVDDMEAFRSDDDRNVMRDIADWSQVTPEMFTRTGRTPEVATAIYNRLNHLIRDLHVLELGLDYRDIYMGDKADSWFYLIPIPATGLFDVDRSASSLPDTTMSASVCNDTLWLQLHSEEPTAKLRFGYDSRVGDTYVVPVIRASKGDANGENGKHLNVRIAESWCNPAYTVVIGLDSTELIDSNDPAWTGMQTFKYRQDKDMIGHKPSEFSYYAKGDTVQFTPVAGNNITLKAGYWYQFRTAFFAALSAETYTADPVHATGHTQFILAIAPDTVRWTPAFPDAANYWNDDHNWTAIRNGADCKDMMALVPMGDTKVIIPQVPEGQLPILSDFVEANIDTLHFGYKKNTCAQILFKPRSQVLGQEKLDYQKAFVDVLLISGDWQTFSPALKHVYSGDMYIPENSATDKDFEPGVFGKGSDYSGTSNPRVWPYAVYQGFYNSAVPVAFYNTDEEGTPVETTTARSKSSVDWVQTNVLDMPYRPGVACVLNAYGPSDKDGEELVVRLPKQESLYYGYGEFPAGSGTYIAGAAVPMQDNGTPRPAYNELNHNLAYDKTTLGKADGITYTLKNETPSEIFFFGNPTMSLVDVYTLCKDNESVLQHESSTYHFTAYHLVDGTNYTAKPITGPGQYFIAPQRAVGLVAKDPATELTITLKPGALVAITGDGMVVSDENIRSDAPVRRMVKEEETTPDSYLYIAAAVETTDEWDWTTTSKAFLTLGVSETATSGFRKGEDALNIASGLNYYSDYSFSTPLSMYTIADNKALMLDMRDTLNMVPLVFTTLDEKYTFSNHTLLSFGMGGQWTAPLFLHDAVTGDSIQIRNGMQIAVTTPLSDQIRYFINGGRRITTPVVTPDDPGVVTEMENVNGEIKSTSSNNQPTIIYDILGRRVKVLGEFELINNVKLPTGVYIIQHGEQAERMVIR